jgi:hypothetical protein
MRPNLPMRPILHEESLNQFAPISIMKAMKTLKYVYWQEDHVWLGYLEEFPDYMTQGETLEELQENLKDIYSELTSGNIPGVRRVAEINIA